MELKIVMNDDSHLQNGLAYNIYKCLVLVFNIFLKQLGLIFLYFFTDSPKYNYVWI